MLEIGVFFLLVFGLWVLMTKIRSLKIVIEWDQEMHNILNDAKNSRFFGQKSKITTWTLKKA